MSLESKSAVISLATDWIKKETDNNLNFNNSKATIVINKSFKNDFCNSYCKENNSVVMRLANVEENLSSCMISEKIKNNNNTKVNKTAQSQEQALKKYSCTYCSYQGKFKSSLQKHLTTHDKDDFLCGHCGLKCGTNLSLQAHMTIHLDDKPFECLVCNRSFKQVSSLRQHMLVHTNVRQISCSMCQFVCQTQKQLDFHMRSHDSSVSCGLCGLKCATSVQLQQHACHATGRCIPSFSKICSTPCQNAVSSGLKSLTCDHCVFACEHKPELTNPIFTNAEVNPFLCSFCDFTCHKKTVLIKHIVQHMNDEDSQGKPEFHKCESATKFEVENSSALDDLLSSLKNSELISSDESSTLACQFENSVSDSSHSEVLNCNSFHKTDVSNEKSCMFECKGDSPFSDEWIASKNMLAGAIKIFKKNKVLLTNDDSDNVEQNSNYNQPNASKSMPKKTTDTLIQDQTLIDSDTNALQTIKSSMNDHFFQTERQSFPCKCCLSSSQTIHPLNEHLVSHQNVKLIQCDSCTSFCHPNANLKEQFSYNVKSYRLCRCELCNLNDISPSDLKKHILTHLHMQHFTCSVCSFTCFKKSRFDKHSLSHTQSLEEKHYSCSHCHFQSKSHKNLKNHMKRHACDKHLTCPHCQFKTTTRPLLKKHLQQKHSDKRPFSCELCSFTCWIASDLKKHTWIHSGLKPFKCSECDYKCRRANRLREHMMIHKNTKPFRCAICLHGCRTKHHLKKHVEIHHADNEQKAALSLDLTVSEMVLKDFEELSDNPTVHFNEGNRAEDTKPISKTLEILKKNGFPVEQYQLSRYLRGPKQFNCTACPYVCKKLSHLKRHMYCHISERPFKCDHCEYTSKTEENLRRHMKRHSGAKPIVCKLCRYSCYELGDMNQHLLTHTDFKAYKCPMCDYTARKKYHLNEHVMTHSSAKSFLCSECGESFRTNCKLKEHMFTHSKEKNIVCSHCAFRCRRQSELNKHMRKHLKDKDIKTLDELGEKPYVCSECGFSCKFYSALKHHMIVHAEGKPYSCPHCSFSSRTHSQLTVHMKKHVEGKPFSCQYCPFNCKHVSSLRRHSLQHICLDPLCCQLCNFTCVRKYDLKRHMKNKHGMIDFKVETDPKKLIPSKEQKIFNWPEKSVEVLSKSTIDICGTSITLDCRLIDSADS